MNISIKTLTGKLVSFHVDKTTSVLSLKKLLTAKEGQPVDVYRLITGRGLNLNQYGETSGRALTLSDFKIEDGDVLH